MSLAKSDFKRLFDRRPTSATLGLSIAAVSFLATFFQHLLIWLTGKNEFIFDFISTEQFAYPVSKDGWQQVLVGMIWSLLGLLACYLALEPRTGARFSVIALIGVKLIAFLGFPVELPDFSNLATWFYTLLIGIAVLPIIFLLTPASNRFYGRNI